MSKSFQFVAATALLTLVLSGSAQASFGSGPYAFSAAADVDNLDTLVGAMTGNGSATDIAQFANSWAQTEMGVHHAVAIGDTSSTRFGALSAWADTFTTNGAAGVAQVSLTLDGEFAAANYAVAGYQLFKSAAPVMPWELMSYLNGSTGLPSGVETVLSGFGDSAGSPGPVHQILSGNFSYAAGETFYLTSVFGVAATGNGAADFANTATFGISMNEGFSTGSGAGYMTAAVPEPETWAMLLVGLGLIGMQANRRRVAVRNIA